MYSTESIERFNAPMEFLNLNNPEEKSKLEAECNKLTYLRTYPTVVRAKIREKKSQIDGLENELMLDVFSTKSQLAQIRRRQELEPRFKDLRILKDELLKLKDELNYAEQVKLLAGAKLNIYQNLLANQEEGIEV